MVWDASYRPFGEATTSGAATLNLRFPGQYYDQETGLHQNGFRDYDPKLGRYIQSDPIGLRGGWNTYAYVGGNPVMRVDLLGLEDPGPGNIDPYSTWPVDPYSDKHTRRNENNKCPGSPPEEDCDDDTYKDHTGKVWTRDPKWAEDRFHGGRQGYKTWRHTEDGWQGGWQCTYNGQNLVTVGPFQGTYDYWSPKDAWSGFQHLQYDVNPHRINSNYVDNVTQIY